MEMTGALHLEAAGRSDIGVGPRAAGHGDEDAVCLLRIKADRATGVETALYAVADGVGQRKGGSVASAQAVNLLEEAVQAYVRGGQAFVRQLGQDLKGPAEYLSFVLTRIDAQLRQNAENNISIAGMATTLTAALVEGREVTIAHVGDSRAYWFSSATGLLTRITRDDTVPGRDTFNPEPAAALGYLPERAAPQAETISFAVGDALILCTDGLWREVDDGLIERVITGSRSPEVAVERLIRAANLRGGRGNISVVVVHIGETRFENDESFDIEFPPAGSLAEGRGRTGPMPVPREAATARPPDEKPGAPPRLPDAMSEVAGPAQPVSEPDATAPQPQDEAPLEEPLGGEESARSSPAPDSKLRTWSSSIASADARAADLQRRPARTSQYMAGVMTGVAATLAVLLIVWGARWLLGRRAAETQAARAPAEKLEGHQMPLYIYQTQPKGGARAAIRYRTYDPATGEIWWKDVAALGPKDPPVSVMMYREEDGLALYLKITYQTDIDTGQPYADILNVKFKPTSTGRGTTKVIPGPAVASDDPLAGHIELKASQSGPVQLIPTEGSGELIQKGASSATFVEGPESGTYVAAFEGVPCGFYRVSAFGTERIVSITRQNPRPATVHFP